jgi:hypothetical protein
MSSSDDDDNLSVSSDISIATTQLRIASDFDDYRLNPHAEPFQHDHAWIWKSFVQQNRDIFYDWVEHFYPLYIFRKTHCSKLVPGVRRFRLNGILYRRKEVRRIMTRFFPVPRGRSFSLHMEKIITRREPRREGLIDWNAFEYWYSLTSFERRDILASMNADGMSWFQLICP